MPYRNTKSSKSTGGKKTGAKKFSNDKFIMMQVGTQFLDEGDYGWKTRILFSDRNDEWSWCVREKAEVIYWFGVTKGRELLYRAMVAGQSLGTSAFFEKDDSMKGNPRINIKGVATEKELAAAKRAAEEEAWLDAEDEEEEADDEDERPAPAARKSKRPMETARKGKSQPPAREYPDLTEEDLEDEEEADDSYVFVGDPLPY